MYLPANTGLCTVFCVAGTDVLAVSLHSKVGAHLKANNHPSWTQILQKLEILTITHYEQIATQSMAIYALRYCSPSSAGPKEKL